MVMEVDDDSHSNINETQKFKAHYSNATQPGAVFSKHEEGKQRVVRGVRGVRSAYLALTIERMDTMPGCSFDSLKDINTRISHSHSKKVIKHALRQQAKRRRKNTTIAAGNSAPLPRIIVKSLPAQAQGKEALSSTIPKPSTMREVLASIPGFSIKPRKRSNKKLSAAAQLEQTKEGCIDLETPDSILVNTNLRALLNKHTFSSLPPLYQHKLVQLLPDVDRASITAQPDTSLRLNTSGLNNEFFARACLEWRERLAEGEFTPENQQKLKAEAEREMSRLDPWKLKHFEPIWGEKQEPAADSTPLLLPSPTRPSLKTTIKLRPSTSVGRRHSKPVPPFSRRLRTVGAVTRAVASYREEVFNSERNRLSEETTSTAEKRTIAESAGISVQEPVKRLKSVAVTEEPAANVEVPETTSTTQDNTKRETEKLELEDKAVAEELACESEVKENNCGENKASQSESENSGCISGSVQDSSGITSNISEVSEKVNEDEVQESRAGTQREEVVQSENNIKADVEEYVGVNGERNIKEAVECGDNTVENRFEVNMETKEVKERDEEMATNVEECIEVKVESEVEDDAELEDDDDDDDDDEGEVEAEAEDGEGGAGIETNNIDADECEIETTQGDQAEEDGEQGPDNSVVQEAHLVQEISAVNDVDQMEYEPVGVHGTEIIHENAILNPTEFVLENDGVIAQEASDSVGSNELKLLPDITSRSSPQEAEDVKQEEEEEEEEEDAEEVQAALFAAVAGGEDCCWDVVDSSTEKLLEEVPIVALEAVPMAVPVALTVMEDGEAAEEVKVIPMQEELEVRLEEGTFPVATGDALAIDWPYVKMDAGVVAANGEDDPSSVNKSTQSQYPEFSTSQAVKLELEVTLTPEAVTSAESLVTSTVGGAANSSSTGSGPPPLSKTNVAPVIPPTTIVCLPSTANLMNHHASQLGGCVSVPSSVVKTAAVASSSAVPYLALSSNTPVRALPTQMPKPQTKVKSNRDSSQVTSGSGGRNSRGSSNKPPPGAVNLERSYQICQAVIQNSPNRDQLRCQLKPPPSLLAANSNASSLSSSKKSEGSGTSRAATQYGVVTSSRNGSGSSNSGGSKPFTPPLPATSNFPVMPGNNGVNNGLGMNKGMQAAQGKVSSSRGPCLQRQQSPPVVVRHHVFTSSQGIPVTMAVLPQSQAPPNPEVVENPGSHMGHVGQYILVQRTGVGDQPDTVQVMLNGRRGAPPRASSAPPANNNTTNNNGSNININNQVSRPGACIGSGAGRGRPASVDVEHSAGIEYVGNTYGEHFVVQCPNPGTQAVTRRERPADAGGLAYGSDGTLQGYTIVGSTGENIAVMEQSYPVPQVVVQGGNRSAPVRQTHNNHISVARTESQCGACNMNAMIMCKKCGAFCHDDCIGPSRLCVTCLIR